MTYEELLKDSRAKLASVGIDNGAMEAWYMIQRCAEIMDKNMYQMFEVKVPEKAVRKYNKMLKERMEHVPLQHILGDTEFMGRVFKVTPDVLVPRQDTEVLVETVMDYWHKHEEGSLRLLDMCTGSGCIAVSLAYYASWKDVTAADVSADALAVASTNAALNQETVKFVESDMFSALEGEVYDVITCNPPYIATAEIEKLMPEVRDHDPRLALDGGEDGLTFYRILAAEAPEHLSEDGMLFMEIGEDQGKTVRAIFEEAGFRDVKVKKDYAENNRIVYCRRPAAE